MRYEIKYPLDKGQGFAFEQWFCESGRPFREIYKPRQVNTISFDLPDLDSYSDNLAGLSNRSKLRLRWYGKELLPSKAVFEIKAKKNSIGTKDLIEVDLSNYIWNDWATLMRQFRRDIPDQLRPVRALLEFPQVLTSYEREYFSDDSGVRLTIDRKLTACSVQKFKDLTARRMAGIPISVIVELKFAVEQRAYANTILKSLPFRPSKFSKYVSSIDRAFP